MNEVIYPIKGSFRDPDGHVFIHSGRVFRGLRGDSARFLNDFIVSKFAEKRMGRSIVNSWKIDIAELKNLGFEKQVIEKYGLWIEHEKLDFISYPFEWSFELLRRAAVFHLDLNIDAIEAGYQIKDATAYNVQFIGNIPTFIDLPSFEPYVDGRPWMAYKQFCEMFLAPLAIQSYNGVSVQSWLKGSIDGINIIECSNVLPLTSYLNFGLLGHIHLQAHATKSISSISTKRNQKEVFIKRENLVFLLKSLRNCILKLKNNKVGYWQNYEKNTSYDDDLTREKEQIIEKFCTTLKGKTLIDIGCNAGQFSEIALKAGLERVIGIDMDSGALDHAIAKNSLHGKKFFPVQFDFINPSPDLGWGLFERQNLHKRLPKCDALVCLAVIHHLVIAKNIPMNFFVEMLHSFADSGVVEFVAKEDPMVVGLLKNRKDIFPDYNLESFKTHMRERFKIQTISSVNPTRSYLKFEIN